MDEPEHVPVMPKQVLQGLALDPDGIYIDCTFGRGGHSRQILSSLSVKGQLLAFDRDIEAVNSKVAKMMRCDKRFDLEQGSFSMLESGIARRGWVGKVSGLLMDLGLCSTQLDEAARGFSFLKDGPLDMRMDATRGVTAAEWLAEVGEQDLADVLKCLGDERFSRRIARAVVIERGNQSIQTTRQLAQLIEQTVPARERSKHPATRSFQAIRVYINRELEELQEGLLQALPILKPAGRLVVIAFHSLEDRIVKRFIRDQSRGGDFPRRLPVSSSAYSPRLRKIGAKLRPDALEVSRNPRSRSAILRVAERLA